MGSTRRFSGGEIGELQKEIAEWANRVIPDRSAFTSTQKLIQHEIPEWIENQDDPLEYADILILVFDVAYLKGIDVTEAIKTKMAINRERTWEKDPLTGIVSHVKKDGE